MYKKTKNKNNSNNSNNSLSIPKQYKYNYNRNSNGNNNCLFSFYYYQYNNFILLTIILLFLLLAQQSTCQQNNTIQNRNNITSEIIENNTVVTTNTTTEPETKNIYLDLIDENEILEVEVEECNNDQQCSKGFTCKIPKASNKISNSTKNTNSNTTTVTSLTVKMCVCSTGPGGFLLNTGTGECKDVDECQKPENANKCDHVCENTPGSWYCKCNRQDFQVRQPENSKKCVCRQGFLLKNESVPLPITTTTTTTTTTTAPDSNATSSLVTTNSDTATTTNPTTITINNNTDTNDAVTTNTNPGMNPPSSSGAEGGSAGSGPVMIIQEMCKDINECEENNGGCGKKLCRNSNGGFDCCGRIEDCAEVKPFTIRFEEYDPWATWKIVAFMTVFGILVSVMCYGGAKVLNTNEDDEIDDGL